MNALDYFRDTMHAERMTRTNDPAVIWLRAGRVYDAKESIEEGVLLLEHKGIRDEWALYKRIVKPAWTREWKGLFADDEWKAFDRKQPASEVKSLKAALPILTSLDSAQWILDGDTASVLREMDEAADIQSRALWEVKRFHERGYVLRGLAAQGETVASKAANISTAARLLLANTPAVRARAPIPQEDLIRAWGALYYDAKWQPVFAYVGSFVSAVDAKAWNGMQDFLANLHWRRAGAVSIPITIDERPASSTDNPEFSRDDIATWLLSIVSKCRGQVKKWDTFYFGEESEQFADRVGRIFNTIKRNFLLGSRRSFVVMTTDFSDSVKQEYRAQLSSADRKFGLVSDYVKLGDRPSWCECIVAILTLKKLLARLR